MLHGKTILQPFYFPACVIFSEHQHSPFCKIIRSSTLCSSSWYYCHTRGISNSSPGSKLSAGMLFAAICGIPAAHAGSPTAPRILNYPLRYLCSNSRYSDHESTNASSRQRILHNSRPGSSTTQYFPLCCFCKATRFSFTFPRSMV